MSWWLATSKRLSPAVRKWFRKNLAYRFPGPFDIEAESVRLRAWPAENRCDRVALGRAVLPERAERQLIEPLLSDDMTFVDVGANIGVYSLFVAAKTAGQAQIVSLEPHPRTYGKLVINAGLNGFSDICAVNLAAGPQEDSVSMFTDGGGNIGGASLLAEASGGEISTNVAIRPLSDILHESGVGKIDLLKADVEGFEDRALLPLFNASEARHLWPRAILIETVHRELWQSDLIVSLLGFGYEITGKTAENLLLQQRDRRG